MSHTAREDLDPPSKYFNCKGPIFDRRLMALKYSETFKISSRAEASLVLKLTQQLSDSLEQYFLNCKGLEILTSSDHGNRKLGSQSIKLQKCEDHDEIPFMSSQGITHRHDEPPQPIPVENSFTQSCSASSLYYSSVNESNCFVKHVHTYGPSQVEQNSEHSSCLPQISLNNDKGVKSNSESKPPVVPSVLEIKAQYDLGMENNESDFDASSLNSSSSQEAPSSSQAQRKTSKSLSPDILQLLKGKDVNTVTNILKTLSPFYTALQDVNLEMLAQVLVNTGALD